MQHAVRPMPEATCCKKQVNRGFSASVSGQARPAYLQDTVVTSIAGRPPRSAYSQNDNAEEEKRATEDERRQGRWRQREIPRQWNRLIEYAVFMGVGGRNKLRISPNKWRSFEPFGHRATEPSLRHNRQLRVRHAPQILREHPNILPNAASSFQKDALCKPRPAIALLYP